MNIENETVVDDLAQAIFEVMRRHGHLKAPAAIAVATGISRMTPRIVRRSATVWQDYRPEARIVLRRRPG